MTVPLNKAILLHNKTSHLHNNNYTNCENLWTVAVLLVTCCCISIGISYFYVKENNYRLTLLSMWLKKQQQHTWAHNVIHIIILWPLNLLIYSDCPALIVTCLWFITLLSTRASSIYLSLNRNHCIHNVKVHSAHPRVVILFVLQ